MYHFPNQQLYHRNPYQQCPISIQDSKLQSLNTIPEGQYHQVLPQIVECNAQPLRDNTVEEPQTCTEVTECLQTKKSATKKLKSQTEKSDASKKAAKKPAVDTSNFSIEERLVAAVWVHDRKYTNTTISEIKHNFRRRFSRDPPSKTTLFAWERKLFSTGNVCDAPRTGRPVNRKNHISEVAASVRSAPTLSLRARALALRLPRSTLHNILRNDLPYAPLNKAPTAEKSVKKGPRKKQTEVGVGPPHPEPHAQYAVQGPAPAPAHTHMHSHGYT